MTGRKPKSLTVSEALARSAARREAARERQVRLLAQEQQAARDMFDWDFLAPVQDWNLDHDNFGRREAENPEEVEQPEEVENHDEIEKPDDVDNTVEHLTNSEPVESSPLSDIDFTVWGFPDTSGLLTGFEEGISPSLQAPTTAPAQGDESSIDWMRRISKTVQHDDQKRAHVQPPQMPMQDQTSSSALPQPVSPPAVPFDLVFGQYQRQMPPQTPVPTQNDPFSGFPHHLQPSPAMLQQPQFAHQQMQPQPWPIDLPYGSQRPIMPYNQPQLAYGQYQMQMSLQTPMPMQAPPYSPVFPHTWQPSPAIWQQSQFTQQPQFANQQVQTHMMAPLPTAASTQPASKPPATDWIKLKDDENFWVNKETGVICSVENRYVSVTKAKPADIWEPNVVWTEASKKKHVRSDQATEEEREDPNIVLVEPPAKRRKSEHNDST